MTDTAPLIEEIEVAVANVAAGSDLTTVLGEAPFDGTVTAVKYIPKSDITGANTDSRTLTVVNKALDGNGSTTVATLALTSGVNASDFDEKEITLSATPANLVVAEGDVLAWTSVHTGTGLADPGGLVRIVIERS